MKLLRDISVMEGTVCASEAGTGTTSYLGQSSFDEVHRPDGFRPSLEKRLLGKDAQCDIRSILAVEGGCTDEQLVG